MGKDDKSGPRHAVPLGAVGALPAFADVGLVLAEVVGRIGPDDLLSADQAYTQADRKQILAHVRLRDMRTISKMAAITLTRTLRGSDKKRGSSLICALSTRFSRGFDNADGLSAEACVNLLHRDTAAEALTSAPRVAEALKSMEGLSDEFVDLVLMDIFRHDHALSPVALGLLVPSAERMRPQVATVIRDAWGQLRESRADLPEAPISPSELRALALAPVPEDEREEAAPAAVPESPVTAAPEVPEVPEVPGDAREAAPQAAAVPAVPAVVPAVAEAPVYDDTAVFGELREELSRVRARFADASGSAERVRQACATERRPADADLRAVLRLAEDFDALRARAESASGAPLPEATADAVGQALDRAASMFSQQHRVLALAHVTGPPMLEDLLSEVREGARCGAPGLDTLADLINLGGAPDAFLERFSLQERFREQAPGRWAPIAGAAAEGLLTVPDRPCVPPPAPPPPDLADLDAFLAEVYAHPPEPTTRGRGGGRTGVGSGATNGVAGGGMEGGGPEHERRGDGADDQQVPQTQQTTNETPTERLPHTAGGDAPQTVAGRTTHNGHGNTISSGTERHATRTASRDAHQTERERATGNAPGEALQAAGDGKVSGGTGGGDAAGGASANGARHGRAGAPGDVGAEACAVRGGKFALAAWMRQAAGRPEAEVAARRCAAIAAEMGEFGGRLSAAYAEAATTVTAQALADDPSGRLLAWASALRAGLVNPTPETARLLEDLAPAISPYPGLTALGEAFAKMAHTGAYLVPDLSVRMRNTAQAAAGQEAAAEAAERFLAESPTQTIKYALATEVWKTLLQEDEPLGRLLGIAARGDTARAADAAEELDRLRTGDTVERMIDATAKIRRANRPGGRIHSGARAKLVDKIGKAFDLVTAWVSATHELEALRAADAEVAWAVKPLDELRTSVTRHRARAEAELRALSTPSEAAPQNTAAGTAPLRVPACGTTPGMTAGATAHRTTSSADTTAPQAPPRSTAAQKAPTHRATTQKAATCGTAHDAAPGMASSATVNHATSTTSRADASAQAVAPQDAATQDVAAQQAATHAAATQATAAPEPAPQKAAPQKTATQAAAAQDATAQEAATQEAAAQEAAARAGATQEEVAAWGMTCDLDAGMALGAAARGVAVLVGEAMRLVDGGPLATAEPSVVQVLNGDLLLCPSLRLEPRTLAPLTPPSPTDLAPLCRAERRDWRAAFSARARLGDHEGTRSLLAVLAWRDRRLAAELRQRRDKLVDEARHDLRDRIEAITDRLAEWHRDGVLPETEVTTFTGELRAFGDDRRDDFGVIDRALGDLERRAHAIRDAEIARVLGRLTALAAESDAVAAVAGRIRACAERGDLITAREFMAQARERKDLPEPSGDAVDHLARFFPRFPQAFDDASTRERPQQGETWLRGIERALHAGSGVADPELATLLAGCGLSPSGLPQSRRTAAAAGLGMWQELAEGPKPAEVREPAIASLLRMIGLEGTQYGGVRKEPDRSWVELHRVRSDDDPVLPAFGSRMSPSGDRLRVLLVWRSPGPQQLVEWLRDQPGDQTVLVLYFGVLSAEQRRQLAAASRKRPAPVTGVLDDALIGYLACLPEASWTTTVGLLAPFGSANPYAPAGDVPEEMFYGRSEQLAEVVGRTGSSFVYGGRQLGKSALLRQAVRRLGRTDPGHRVIFETVQQIGRLVPVSAIWPVLAAHLAEAGILPESARTSTDPAEIRLEVKTWIDGDPARQVLILLDEADAFLDGDAAGASFANVTALRDLMAETGGRVKVVFAGLHRTARFQSLPNQPFAQLGAPVAIGPLDPQDAFDLLTRPLAALGLRFDPASAARVIAEANNAPALIQLFAGALLTRLRRMPVARTAPPYPITRADVDAVWRDAKVAKGFRDRFEWTLNLDKRYKVITYTVAFHALDAGADATMTAGELRAECAGWWPKGFRDATGDVFPGLLDECVDLGVLAVDGGRYRLRTPHVLSLLGGAGEIEAVLERAEGFEEPGSFDARSYRSSHLGGIERSPLTGEQVTRLLRPHDAVHLVTGSAALGIDRVAAALAEAAERHRQARVWRVGRELTFERARRRTGESAGHDVIVVELAGRRADEAEALLREATAALSASRKGTLAVALVAPPEHAVLWPPAARQAWAAVQVTELCRFDRRTIRQWMLEEEPDLTDEAAQHELLRATGGWPTLISAAVTDLTRPGSAREPDTKTDCEPHRESGRESGRVEACPGEFVRSTGVLAGAALGAAWRLLAAQTEIAESPETLADLLALAGADEPDHPLSEAALRAEGFASPLDLVEVLRMLGALVPRPDGRLEREDVLTAATRRLGAGR
ncbi:hypothetical protein [Spongiactinospora sp. TRM90649]|uniref:hypothetical protein n=1 Tax=Spongiactinospora sp. TRM90649 TaxID=3031114 RepID=UPI0023F7415C|nr:hypothetical protein [Spongiactinospora sp. TRM90649]MDF5757190.1 hypothetical protein [Spongiactinospora sp. TRM90649]